MKIGLYFNCAFFYILNAFFNFNTSLRVICSPYAAVLENRANFEKESILIKSVIVHQ